MPDRSYLKSARCPFDRPGARSSASFGTTSGHPGGAPEHVSRAILHRGSLLSETRWPNTRPRPEAGRSRRSSKVKSTRKRSRTRMRICCAACGWPRMPVCRRARKRRPMPPRYRRPAKTPKRPKRRPAAPAPDAEAAEAPPAPPAENPRKFPMRTQPKLPQVPGETPETPPMPEDTADADCRADGGRKVPRPRPR